LYKLSAESIRILKGADADIQLICNELIKIYDFKALCSYRDKAGQDKAVADGTSKTPWPKSKHNVYPSLAIDIVPWFVDIPHIRWDEKHRRAFYYMMGMAVAIAARHGIEVRIGANWDMDIDPDDWDLPHLELVKKK
jgi:peptidoglycan L-alanyl-D-glutamate endopeptidase CwlK